MKARLTKLWQATAKVLGMLALIAFVVIVGYSLLGAIAAYVGLIGKTDWTVRDWVGSLITALVVGFMLLSSVLAFLAAVIEGRKLSGRK